ncbi:WD40 repeat domain-containing protein [Tundrisphaera sp. TA3]|uniref:WD40 repeat domain-containing protein n=1 Tax=Tundrisphaera sp. TA3 TaxID=3435775 RepID=UPI003EB86016
MALVLIRPTAPASGQDARAFRFEAPILVINPRGHSAPVRSLLFSPDGSRLFSGGFDKAINVWNVQSGAAELVQTLRPPIHRGDKGRIYALALSPAADPAGGRLLAVAGRGANADGSNILIYRYPGRPGHETGDLVAQLPRPDPRIDVANAHVEAISSLAFSPDGAMLASASADSKVILWDLAAMRPRAVLLGHAGPVNVVAFTPDGRHLVSGGDDGVPLVWEVARPTAPIARGTVRTRFANEAESGRTVNSAAVSPDGHFVFVGHENGLLKRYTLPSLTEERILPIIRDQQGAIEGIACSPDGRHLLTSCVRLLANEAGRPSNECDIELRSMPDGRVVRRLAVADNLAYALAFSPDSKTAAISGGDAQPIRLFDIDGGGGPRITLQGEGSSIWDVGFNEEGTVVGFTRQRVDDPGGAGVYDGFDLRARRFTPLPAPPARRAIRTDGGWTVRPDNPYALGVFDPAGLRVSTLSLDRGFDRRWWSYSFIPGNPKEGHPRRMVAVACEAGVAFFEPETGNRTRLYVGHVGPTYALAPSPDGRWLATGSMDQTVRLWPLAGCDTLPPLGARFRLLPDGTARAESVTPRGFAEGVGLKEGDIIDAFYQGSRRYPPGEFLQQVDPDRVAPNVTIAFHVRGQEFPIGTTRRDQPLINLFATPGGQWVFWTPRGFYDTSLAGDHRHLGWHLNHGTPEAPGESEYFPIDRYEKEFRRPELLAELVATADLGRALAALDRARPQTPAEPSAFVEANPLPRVRILAPTPGGAATAQATVPVRASATPGGAAAIRSIRISVNGASEAGRTFAINPPSRVAVQREAVVPLRPGPNRILVLATDDRGREHSASLDLASTALPGTKERQPRLDILAVGVEGFADPQMAIPYAERDAAELADFFAAGRAGRTKYADSAATVLAGKEATAENLARALGDLDEAASKGQYGPGDTLIVAIESHLLSFDQSTALLGAGGDARSLKETVPSETMAEPLGRLAEAGCRVVLLLDGAHKTSPGPWGDAQEDWIRDLWRNRGVIAFVASTDGPSGRQDVDRLGLFARGILDFPGRRLNRKAPLTLDEFKAVIEARISDLSRRGQRAECLIPDALSPATPFLEPASAAAPPKP